MPTYHPLKLNSVNSRTLLFRKISAPLHQKHFIYNKDYLQSFLLLNFTSAELIVRNYCTDMFRKTSAKYFYYFTSNYIILFNFHFHYNFIFQFLLFNLIISQKIL